eukprot:c5104_g1_i2.p1 GENE.c5104_g1_i2~~c5104_g1_i2.p1  ORF type:complete len:251 (+),score=57.94 c5104_g1_i2:360-1112(+)
MRQSMTTQLFATQLAKSKYSVDEVVLLTKESSMSFPQMPFAGLMELAQHIAKDFKHSALTPFNRLVLSHQMSIHLFNTVVQFSTLSKADVLNIQIRQQRGHMTRDKLLTLWHQARRICQLDDAVSLNEEPPKALTSTETPFVIDTKPTQLHSTIFVPTSDVKEEPSTIKALPTNPFTQHIQSRIFDFPIPSRLLSYNSLAIKFPAKYEELPPKIPIPEKKALPPVRAVSDPILALSQAAELLGDFVSVRL